MMMIMQAEPLFKDKRRFIEMADPLLEGNFPKKALYQALAVAGMCLQEEASTRPVISDVVTALEYLSMHTKNSTQTIQKAASPSSGLDGNKNAPGNEEANRKDTEENK